MYNQIEVILSQYEIETREVTKGRGSYICDTDKGRMVLVPFRGSEEKGMLLCRFLSTIEEKGLWAERIMLTANGTAVSEDDYTGERFLLKSYVEGAEISTSKLDEMKAAVRVLAIYHNISSEFSCKEELLQRKEGTLEILQRHYKELIKVKNYIRNRKKKNEFEQIYMRQFDYYRKLAEASFAMLEENESEALICHGDFNQHNVVRCGEQYGIINFENFEYNWPMVDLSNFVRKMLEKNEWKEDVGRELIAEYSKYRPLQSGEYKQLSGLLLFPEKFWKVTNHYMNSRKTWISGRDIDKLRKVIEQEEKRLKFVENVFSFRNE